MVDSSLSNRGWAGIECEHRNITFFFFILFAWFTTNIGNFVNDYFDIDSDVIGRPKAPLASGAATKDFALKMLIAEYLMSIILLFGAVYTTGSFPLFALGMIAIICTYVYSVPPFKTKSKAAAGPITISIAYMSVILGGFVLSSGINILAIKISFFFALLMLGIGFSKDFMHIDADRGFCNTPPIAYGIKYTSIIAALSLTSPIIFSGFFTQLPYTTLILFLIPLSFAFVAVYYMSNEPTAKNHNIVMPAFLVYLNSVLIIIGDHIANAFIIFILLVILNLVFIIKTWIKGIRNWMKFIRISCLYRKL